MYGQRVGALIGISSDEEVADEFLDINKCTSRATWSNNCRPAMRTMANIMADPDKFAAYEAERNCYYQLIRDRAEIFKQEAEQVGLPMLPYRGGFFITIPTDASTVICEELKKEHIYVIDKPILFSQLKEECGTREKITEKLLNRCNELGQMEFDAEFLAKTKKENKNMYKEQK